jgi:hypothetical protein
LQLFRLSIRPSAYLPERMFPQLRERLGTALDLVVEFSTLGEYTLGAPDATQPAGAPASPSEQHAPQLGGADRVVGQAAVRRTVAGGTAASRGKTLGAPAATPAARRLQARSKAEEQPTAGAIAAPHTAPAAPTTGADSAAPPATAPHAHLRPGRVQQRRRRTRAGAPPPPVQPCLSARGRA